MQTEFSISIDTGRFWPLRNLWVNQRFCDWFWRLYHNDRPGAGVVINGVSTELTPDKFYLISPGTNFKTWEHEKLYQFYIHFDASVPFTMLKRELYSFDRTPVFDQLFELIKPQLKEGPEFYTPIGKTLCISMSAYALSLIPESDLVMTESNDMVEKIIARMKAALNQNFSIEHTALSFGICKDSLTRIFKRHTGITPYKYLTMLRMNKASFLLENTMLPIEEITEALGFNDRFHFSRTFKSHSGISPAAYRKLRQN